MKRIPIVRKDATGAVMDDGTARLVTEGGRTVVDDFRDLDGQPLDLPPGWSFELRLEEDRP